LILVLTNPKKQKTFTGSRDLPGTLRRYLFRGQGIYLIPGKVTEEYGYAGPEIQKMTGLPLRPEP